MKKLELQLDALGIESFETGAVPRPEEGTVEAQAMACTDPASCRCPTAIINCGTIASTAYSCRRTFDCV